MARLTRTRRAEVLAAATRLRDDLDLLDDEPVDIFDVIRRVGVWLVFQPMDKLLGVTLSAGAGGIIITTQRDVSMQRFTAAHELGHLALHGEEDTWDFEQDVEATSTSAKELEANVFAASFLLPRSLLNQRLRDYGIRRDAEVPAAVVYLISRDLGLSYAATASRIAEVKNLAPRARERLQQVRPIDVKRELLAGREPENRRAQVWLPAERDKPTFAVDVGDEMFADLPESPSTGYRWTRPSEPADDAAVTILGNEYAPAPEAALEQSPSERVIGGQGVRQLHLRAESEGEWAEQFILRRPFEPQTGSEDSIEFRATVRPRPQTLSSRFNTQLPELDAE
ncbi:ImmA/IrrE family metallo-endopeptidase [Curtobacterium sp. PhB136]|uniref:ImmA/IrrE family metallo-endopeptidase n=1 Tax=Curtobacterium sp. PhB136 TaxID=2485181 RepID=UPI00104E878B|nr:ImmA/IrrE family metallo-endopeptidase [Curtobacterium sp. PhB136]TCK65831.1 chagasin family peptidase inhibitor I42 [Curtobacterium sp. PhB136]